MSDAPAPTLRIRTESGTVYEIDEPGGWLRRAPGQYPPSDESLSEPLRRDGAWIKLLRMGEVRLGASTWFNLEPLDDPAQVLLTTRTTTYVVAIDRLPGDA